MSLGYNDKAKRDKAIPRHSLVLPIMEKILIAARKKNRLSTKEKVSD